MHWFLVIGAVVCCWAMLRVMGAEREGRITAAKQAATPPAPAVTPPPAAPKKKPSAWGAKRQPRQAA